MKFLFTVYKAIKNILPESDSESEEEFDRLRKKKTSRKSVIDKKKEKKKTQNKELSAREELYSSYLNVDDEEEALEIAKVIFANECAEEFQYDFEGEEAEEIEEMDTEGQEDICKKAGVKANVPLKKLLWFMRQVEDRVQEEDVVLLSWKNDYSLSIYSGRLYPDYDIYVMHPASANCEYNDGIGKGIFKVNKSCWLQIGEALEEMDITYYEEDCTNGGHGCLITYNLLKMYKKCKIIRADSVPDSVSAIVNYFYSERFLNICQNAINP